MDSKDLPEALSAAVLQFCQDHVQYTGNLSVHKFSKYLYLFALFSISR